MTEAKQKHMFVLTVDNQTLEAARTDATLEAQLIVLIGMNYKREELTKRADGIYYKAETVFWK